MPIHHHMCGLPPQVKPYPQDKTLASCHRLLHPIAPESSLVAFTNGNILNMEKAATASGYGIGFFPHPHSLTNLSILN
jgi:hypothetical protein